MKKFILIIFLLLVANNVFAADGDITQSEVMPDVSSWKLDTVKFLVVTKTCVVTYRKVDASNNPINEFDVIFMNREDDPLTPENEYSEDFTLLVTAINNGSNIKNTIKNAVETTLGL